MNSRVIYLTPYFGHGRYHLSPLLNMQKLHDIIFKITYNHVTDAKTLNFSIINITKSYDEQ